MIALSAALCFLGVLAFSGWYLWLRRTDEQQAFAAALARTEEVFGLRTDEVMRRVVALEAERGKFATRLGSVETKLHLDKRA